MFFFVIRPDRGGGGGRNKILFLLSFFSVLPEGQISKENSH